MKKWMKAALAVFCMVSAVVVGVDRIQDHESKQDHESMRKHESKQDHENKQDYESIHEQGFYEKYIKRVQDFWCACLAMAVLSPVLAVTALLVRINLGSPVIFKQERPGKGERIFELYKFRTMTDERDSSGRLLPDGARLTVFGRKLRATSLDELPELFNIIRGDMSVVGPRPLLTEYLPRYDEKQRHRHDVRPGLTGLAQVSGRNGISWEEKFEADCDYVGKVSFLNDWKIVLKTVAAVWKREGISAAGGATMGEFMGNG